MSPEQFRASNVSLYARFTQVAHDTQRFKISSCFTKLERIGRALRPVSSPDKSSVRWMLTGNDAFRGCIVTQLFPYLYVLFVL